MTSNLEVHQKKKKKKKGKKCPTPVARSGKKDHRRRMTQKFQYPNTTTVESHRFFHPLWRGITNLEVSFDPSTLPSTFF